MSESTVRARVRVRVRERVRARFRVRLRLRIRVRVRTRWVGLELGSHRKSLGRQINRVTDSIVILTDAFIDQIQAVRHTFSVAVHLVKFESHKFLRDRKRRVRVNYDVRIRADDARLNTIASRMASQYDWTLCAPWKSGNFFVNSRRHDFPVCRTANR
jgi:hypothetical protein